MINLLLEGYDLALPYLRNELKQIIHPGHKVAAVAFAFRDSKVRTAADWRRLYGKDHGKYYAGIANGFTAYGVSENDIVFVNYFEDTKESARKKIENADIVYFPGGLPDRMMERIEEFGLTDILRNHDGIIMGYSAGAVIQLREYHLSPDEDYPGFAYYNGLGYLDGFYHEVHYEGTSIQKASIERVLKERGGKVYATRYMQGTILVEDGKVRLLGDVEVFGDVH